jgi:hypothetical protein
MRMAATLIMAISWMGACAPVEFAPETGILSARAALLNRFLQDPCTGPRNTPPIIIPYLSGTQ